MKCTVNFTAPFTSAWWGKNTIFSVLRSSLNRDQIGGSRETPQSWNGRFWVPHCESFHGWVVWADKTPVNLKCYNRSLKARGDSLGSLGCRESFWQSNLPWALPVPWAFLHLIKVGHWEHPPEMMSSVVLPPRACDNMSLYNSWT